MKRILPIILAAILVLALLGGCGKKQQSTQLKMLDFTGTSGNFQVSDEEINIGISVRKGNTDLLDKLNAALATLTTDDFNRMMDEAIKVQPLSAGDAQSSPDTQSSAGAQPTDDANQPVLRVGMECAYAPYNWTQPTDANGAVPIKDSSDYAYGYDVMMAKYLADKIGYRVEINKMDWDSIPLAVQSGTIDCGICGQSITSERMQTVDFTTPYYYASIVCLVRADSKYANAASIADLSGATGTSQLNTVWYDTCLPQIPNVKMLPAMETAPAMLVALTSGKCDVVVTDKPTALAAVAAYGS